MSITEGGFHQLKTGSVLNKKYAIKGVLGEGGFGITYLAEDTTLDISVAIKEYYPSGFATREVEHSNTVTAFTGEKLEVYEAGKSKFLKEARTLAKLAGESGIVAVKDFFQENNTAYIVMEYLDGITLKDYLKKSGGKITADETIKFVKPIVESLGEVHKHGMIHRDISPDNIMVMPGDKLKLLDFGAARDVNVNGEKSLSVMLKPGYAPEEQYRTRGQQGPWTDVYALCATVYRCIVGHIPDESMERVRKDGLQKPSELGLDIDADQEATLMKGMAVFKEDRIQSAEELYGLWYGEKATVAVMGGMVGENMAVSGAAASVADIGELDKRDEAFKAVKDEASEASEKKEKKKKLIPIWICGAAAVLFIGLLSVVLGNSDKKNSDNGNGSTQEVMANGVSDDTSTTLEQKNDDTSGDEKKTDTTTEEKISDDKGSTTEQTTQIADNKPGATTQAPVTTQAASNKPSSTTQEPITTQAANNKPASTTQETVTTQQAKKKPTGTAQEPKTTKTRNNKPATTTQVTTAHIHSYTSQQVVDNCSIGPYIRYTCSCGDTYKGEQMAPIDHNWIEESTGYEMCEGGTVKTYCTICGYSYSDTYTGMGHMYMGGGECFRCGKKQ